MPRPTTRRRLLLSLTALPAVALLAACGDDGNGQAEATSESGPQDSAPQVAAPRSLGTVDMDELLQPGALPEMVEGADDAPVTIVEYASMTCGHCANFHVNTYPDLKERYLETGQARLIIREFPFDPRAEAAFMLARCSDDKYFAMVDVLFKQQSNWASVEDARGALLSIARLAGFSQESFEACLTDQNLLNDVRAVRAVGADKFGVDATPTFFINGKKYSGAMSIEEMAAIIDPLL